MFTPPSDTRQLVPIRESMAILRLVRHRDTPLEQTPPPVRESRRDRRRDERAEATPVRKPTPAECYGCVEWFPY